MYYLDGFKANGLAVHCPDSLILRYICDRISENGAKSHMKSIVFQHAFNCISSNLNVFREYL